MFFTDLTQVLVRRWYLVLLGLLLAAGAGLATYTAVPPAYSANAEVLLLPPETVVPDGGNPYLSLSGLTPAGDVLARALSDPKAATDVAAAGGNGRYTVELDGNSPAPLVVVLVEADSPRDAMTTLGLVLDRLPKTLREVQAAASVPPDAYITPSEVTRTTEPTKSMKSQIRALVVTVGAVVVLALLATAALDALLRSPRRGRRFHDSFASTDDGAPVRPTTDGPSTEVDVSSAPAPAKDERVSTGSAR